MHVLIVEDDPVMQQLLATLLRGLDSQIHTHLAETVDAGLKLWRKHPIKLVLCDWNLPHQQTGLTLVKAIRAKDTQLPIIMITGNGNRATVTDSARHKVNAFIVKPFDPSSVMERLKPYLVSSTTTPSATDSTTNLDDQLDAFVSNIDPVLDRLTIMPGAEAALAQRPQAQQLSARQLAQQWQSEVAITTRLIRLANSSLMRRTGAAITTLSEAIATVGVDMALTQALAVALADTNRLRHPTLKTLANTFNNEAQKTAEYAALLAKRLKLNAANCYTAGLMVRLGECATLDAIQLYIDAKGEVTDAAINSALNKHAAQYGNAIKMQWRLPLALRERIGATYSATKGQVNPELLLMRLAACLISDNEHGAEQEKLCRQLHLTPTELPGGGAS